MIATSIGYVLEAERDGAWVPLTCRESPELATDDLMNELETTEDLFPDEV